MTMDLRGCDDAVVVAAVLAGDQEAYAILVERHHGSVRRIVTRMLVGRAEGDELVQEVFVAAYQDLRDFDRQRPLAGWLTGIAKHQVLMRLRQQRRSHRLLEAYRHEAINRLGNETAESTEPRQAALRDCQAALAPLAARAVELRYQGGLDLAAVAERLGRSLVATRQLLYRIRAQLRACLEQRGVDLS